MTDMIEIEALGSAAQLGHDLEVDKPDSTCSTCRRWTCQRCGDTIPGSASERACRTGLGAPR